MKELKKAPAESYSELKDSALAESKSIIAEKDKRIAELEALLHNK